MTNNNISTESYTDTLQSRIETAEEQMKRHIELLMQINAYIISRTYGPAPSLDSLDTMDIRNVVADIAAKIERLRIDLTIYKAAEKQYFDKAKEQNNEHKQ